MDGIEVNLIEGGTGDLLLLGDKSENFTMTVNVAPKKVQGYVYQSDGKPITINHGRINWWGRDPNWVEVKGYRGARDLEKPIGQWNRYEIIAKGQNLDVFLNGVLVNRVRNVKPYKGKIQIQAESAEIFFRRLDLIPIDASTPPNTLSQADKLEGFDLIFDGETLDGWKRHEGLPGHGVAGKWTVDDGAIVGMQDPPGKGGFLTTSQKYKDFELRLETKIDWPFDSGIFLRVGPHGKSHQVTLDYRPSGEIGGIYCPWTQGSVFPCPDGIKYFKKDQWNKIRITCQGEPARIRVWVNDTIVTDFQHTEKTTAGIPKEGTLALQIHPGEKGYENARAMFRAIRIKDL